MITFSPSVLTPIARQFLPSRGRHMQNAMCDIFTTKHLFCAPELLPLLPVQSTYLHIHMCTGLLGGGEMGMLVWGELGLAKMKIKGEWLRGGGSQHVPGHRGRLPVVCLSLAAFLLTLHNFIAFLLFLCEVSFFPLSPTNTHPPTCRARRRHWHYNQYFCYSTHTLFVCSWISCSVCLNFMTALSVTVVTEMPHTLLFQFLISYTYSLGWYQLCFIKNVPCFKV